MLFTVFALDSNKIVLQRHNDFALSSQLKQQILNVSNIKQGKSTFFINKTKAKSQIESNFPNLKVINIETTFPNGLVFHLAQREELFAVKNHTLNTYTILDADFKVLKVLEGESEFNQMNAKPILLEFNGSGQTNLLAGRFSTLQEDGKLIVSLAKSFLINGRDVAQQKHIFKSISLMGEILVLTLQDDYQIRIHKPSHNLHEKVSAMFSSMSLIYPTYQTGYMLEIHQTQDGILASKFSRLN